MLLEETLVVSTYALWAALLCSKVAEAKSVLLRGVSSCTMWRDISPIWFRFPRAKWT